MVKRSDRSKQKKTSYMNADKISLILNILLCIISAILISYKAIKYKDINLYMAVSLIICIILSNLILYIVRNRKNCSTDNLNSYIAKRRINNSGFDLCNSIDYRTGLYNYTFLEKLLKKIEDEKFIPTSICIFHICGLCQIMHEEDKNEVISKTCEIIMDNKLESTIACISENNNIVLIMIKNNKNELQHIAKKICREFSEVYNKLNIKLIYSIEQMDKETEIIYDVFGRVVDNLNSFLSKM